jgi:hypothetical protein
MSKITSTTSADGLSGIIMWSIDRYVFRVYDKTLPEWTFKEYDLKHEDLAITIKDPTANLYEHSDGRLTLDDHILKVFNILDNPNE